MLMGSQHSDEVRAMAQPVLPRVEPETVGLSSARLRRLGEALRRDIEAAQLPGAVVAVARAGKLAHLEAVGYRDPASRDPLKRSEEHTSELQSLRHLVCRLLLEKKKKKHK